MSETGRELLIQLGDQELARRAADGSRIAFEELVRRYEGRLFNFILRRVRREEDAEDIAQQAFLQAWLAIGRYDGRWNFSTWLYTIAMRLAATAAQQDRRREATAVAAARSRREVSHDAATAWEARQSQNDLWSLADHALDEEARLALWMRYVDDLAPRDIARVLGRTSLSVRVLLHRARRRLAEAMEAEHASGGIPSRAERPRLKMACAKGIDP